MHHKLFIFIAIMKRVHFFPHRNFGILPSRDHDQLDDLKQSDDAVVSMMVTECQDRFNGRN